MQFHKLSIHPFSNSCRICDIVLPALVSSSSTKDDWNTEQSGLQTAQLQTTQPKLQPEPFVDQVKQTF